MGKAAYGLMWEEWRRTRWMVGGVFLTILIGTAAGMFFPPFVEEIKVNFNLCITLGLGLYLLFSNSTPNDIRIGLPSRLYLLPVNTFGLVFWKLTYRLSILLLFAGLMTLLRTYCLALPDTDYAQILVPAGIFAWAQTLTWTARLLGGWITSILVFLSLFPGIYVSVR